jgi:hypothetical protein
VTARRASKLLVLAIAAAAAASCGEDEAIRESRKREETANRNRKANIEKRIEELAASIEKEPLDLENNKYEADKIAADAQTAGLEAEFAARLAKMKEDAGRAFQDAAESRARKAVEKAKALASELKFKEAKKEIETLPFRLRSTPAWAACEQALAEISASERAEALWRRNSEESQRLAEKGEPERARGVIEAFLALAEALPAFRTSPRVKEAQAAAKALDPAIDKARAARASDAAIKWRPAFTGRKDDLFKWELDRPEAVEVNSEKVCVFKYEKGEDPTTFMTFNPEGADLWEDYVVTAKAWIGENEKKLYVIVHGELEGPEGERERHWDDVAPLYPYDRAIPRGKWVDLRLEARGGEITLYCDGVATMTNGKKAKRAKGPFQIRIEKGAEIRLKEVWVKVYKPA